MVNQKDVAMPFSEIDWNQVESIIDIFDKSKTICVKYSNGQLWKFYLPNILFSALIDHGKLIAEKQFIKQDLNRDDQEHGIY